MTSHPEEVEFVEVGVSDTGFCLSLKSLSWVEKCEFKKIIFIYDTHPRRKSIVPSLNYVRPAVAEELRHTHTRTELRFCVLD